MAKPTFAPARHRAASQFMSGRRARVVGSKFRLHGGAQRLDQFGVVRAGRSQRQLMRTQFVGRVDLFDRGGVRTRLRRRRPALHRRIDIGREDGNRLVAVADDFEHAELLGKVAQRRGLDLPESELGTGGVGRFERGYAIQVAMPGDPQDEAWIFVQLGEQIRLGHVGGGVPADVGLRRLDADRHVRGDDHELTIRLSVVEPCP